jgi:SnoaL-like domain
MSDQKLSGGPGGMALDTALAYFDAWSRKDIEATMSHVASDIVCDAPTGRIEGALAFREFWAGFMKILGGAKLIAAFGGETTALIMYDTETLPVKSAPGAECLTVKDGKITACRIVFDRGAFMEARAKAAEVQA